MADLRELTVQRPSLQRLPPPPVGCSGWPWTVECAPAAAVRADGKPWPRITIVTPSYNQGRYLEQTIRSVLLQGYPDLEYIVIDGGSTDNSGEIIRRYERWITYWVSEKDRGQADAINKGLSQASGEIFQFVNSDDYLALNALRTAATGIQGYDALAGAVVNFDPTGAEDRQVCCGLRPVNFITRPSGYLFHQPGIWLRTPLVKALGGFNAMYRYKFDWDLLIRYFERWPRVAYINDTLAFFRLHEASKTVSEGMAFWDEEVIARELLLHQVVHWSTRSALRRFVRRRHWRMRVDELVRRVGMTRTDALARICWEAMQDPIGRIDRYSAGALRQLLKG